MSDFGDTRKYKDFPGISREFLVEKKVVHLAPGRAIEVEDGPYGNARNSL